MLSRRTALTTLVGGTALIRAAAVRAATPGSLTFPDCGGEPGAVRAWTDPGEVRLERASGGWGGHGVEVRVLHGAILVSAPRASLSRIALRWPGAPSEGLLYLGDQWERSYGDLGWRGLDPERALPWYFLATRGAATVGVGVRTGGGAFAYWQVDGGGVTLVLDVRSGGRGVRLGDRQLAAATVVYERMDGVSAFAAARRFCHRLCDAPRLPAKPVYGGNNWYYAYGKSSADDIRRDSERMASCAPAGNNRPFMVIDDGWSPFRTAGPWDRGNAQFPDMPKLAADIRGIGVRPGIWVRPLITQEAVPDGWKLNSPAAAREAAAKHGWTLDPTVPEVLEQVEKDIRRVRAWGYELIKHDFSTFDIVGRWGFDMGAELTDEGWGFADVSRTTAEIIRALYRTIREGAEDTLVLGCNTVGHLAAGLFELQRTGDDTSGREWRRTRKMGINTLAFRSPQHGAFFAIDADCVGLTRDVPWAENRQWLDLLARSGTPLFVSASPDAMGSEQRQAVREAFAHASRAQPLGEPLDWMKTTEPARWNFGGTKVDYRWFPAEG